MKAAAKCDNHCELHYFLNHLRVERILLFRFILKACFLRTQAASKCDKHCELHVFLNHLRVERMLFFRFIFESMFSYDASGIEVW